MKSVLFRTIVGWIVLSLLVIPAVLLPAAFLGRWLGTAYINDISGIARGQSGELLQIIVSQSEGDLSADRLVLLASTMASLEERTMRQTQGIAAVREIALIDTKGRVLAHNDVTKIAKNTPSRFTEDKYLKIAQRTRRDSIAILPIEGYNPALPSNPVARKISEAVLPEMKKMFPELFVSAYEATSAVYPVDGEIPSGGVVMVVENRAPIRVFGAISALLSPVSMAAGGAILLVLFLYLPVLALIAGRRKEEIRSMDSIPSVEAMPNVEPASEGELDSDLHAPEAPHVDFGEVPLPDFIQGAEVPVHSPQENLAYAGAAGSSSGPMLRPALDEILDAIPVEPD